jgi:hypothetical protein
MWVRLAHGDHALCRYRRPLTAQVVKFAREATGNTLIPVYYPAHLYSIPRASCTGATALQVLQLSEARHVAEFKAPDSFTCHGCRCGCAVGRVAIDAAVAAAGPLCPHPLGSCALNDNCFEHYRLYGGPLLRNTRGQAAGAARGSRPGPTSQGGHAVAQGPIYLVSTACLE